MSRCDAHAYFSNVSMVGKTRTTPAILGSMDVGRAVIDQVLNRGRNALNTKIFMQAYSRILADRWHERYSWLVKVDIDTILVVHRLHALLATFSPSEPVVLKATTEQTDPLNRSLTGALIPVSQAAFTLFARSAAWCMRSVEHERIAEDFWFGLCLDALGVRQVLTPALCRFDRTPERPDSDICTTHGAAALHPRLLERRLAGRAWLKHALPAYLSCLQHSYQTRIHIAHGRTIDQPRAGIRG